MPTNNTIKLKMDEIFMAPNMQCWCSDHWLNNWSSVGIKCTQEQDGISNNDIQASNNTAPHSDDEITKKKPRSIWNSLF